jgi:hypothetical protein
MAESGLTFQKYGKGAVIRIHSIAKKDVLEGNTDNIKGMLDSAVKELKETEVVQPWNMMISGYGRDTRPMTQIPEVSIWFRKAHGAYPYLPIFLSHFSLSNYLFAQLYNLEVVTTHKKQDLSVVQRNEIEKLVSALNKFEPSLGDECRKQLEYRVKYKVDLEEVQKLYADIKSEARTYLSLNAVSIRVSDRAIMQAFVRINQVLEN